MLIPEKIMITLHVNWKDLKFTLHLSERAKNIKKILHIYFPSKCRELEDKAVYFMMKMLHDYLIITS